MKKQTRSILEELNNLHPSRDNDLFIEMTANNILRSCSNLITKLHEMYDEDTANDLEKRFINSVRSGDPQKFQRKMNQIKEGKMNAKKTI